MSEHRLYSGIWHTGWCVCVMWSELLMTSAISCPLWSSVYKYQRVECVFTSPERTECGMFVCSGHCRMLCFVPVLHRRVWYVCCYVRKKALLQCLCNY